MTTSAELENLKARDTELHDAMKALEAEHTAVTRKIAGLGGYPLEILDQERNLRTPCALGIAGGCLSGERPGYPLVVIKGTDDWVCPPCASLFNPGTEAERGRQEREAYAQWQAQEGSR
jgi:hypothetical protein